MGTDSVGHLLYTADGRFSVTISRDRRARFAAGDLLSGTTEERARAAEDFVAYAGRYTLWRPCPRQTRPCLTREAPRGVSFWLRYGRVLAASQATARVRDGRNVTRGWASSASVTAGSC